jgi:glycosyltransferase involved in cell wall biosynthesis
MAVKETQANTATIAFGRSTLLFKFEFSITTRMSAKTVTPSKALPRVLFAVALDPTLKFGSLEEQIISLARAFDLNDGLFCPLFICPEGSNKPMAFQEAGIEVECMDLRSFRWSGLARLSRIISQRRITVVHWNFTEMLRNSYVWWLTLLHPSVSHRYTDHISRIPSPRHHSRGPKQFLKQLLLRRYEKIFCVSQYVLDDLRSQQTRSDLVLARHFVNTDRFRPDTAVRNELRNQLHVEDRFVLLTVAQLIKEKGIEVLLRALAGLPESVVLWIVGDGDESERLCQLCSELQLTSRVRFLGLQKNVAPLMQAADCFVCPSLWAEAAGLVNLEASASGLPVIASRTGGISEYVEDGRTGFLFLPGDHHGLTRCVQSLYEDSAMHQKMSAEARTWAVEKFSADAGVLAYVNLYRE